MKKILTRSLLGLALVLGLTPAVLPARVVIERKAEVPAGSPAVFRFLADLNQFGSWSPFQELDPEQKTEIQGSGVGAKLTWQSKRMGEGVMTVESLEDDRSVRIRMDFASPMPGTGISLWSLNSTTPTSTEVTWHFEQDLPYFQRYFGLMMDRMLGAHFEKGLQNLRGKFAP